MCAATTYRNRLAGVATASLMFIAALPALAAATPAPLVFEPYAFETEHHGTIAAEVAFLDVPLRHARPDGPHTRLRVVRLPALERRAGVAPVVYLAGGPGGSGVGTARGVRWPVFNEVRRHVDVLLFDQRGTGLSAPPPACPFNAGFSDAEPLERNQALTALRATAARCIAYWQRGGVDLGAYTTAESADDLEALRQALNVPRISLWGMSYGTHLAMAAARRHESGIDRLVLMGLEGPDQTLKLPLSADALLADLAPLADRAGFNDLAGSAKRVLATVCATPATGRSLMHRGRQVRIGCMDAQLAISAALGRRSTQQMLPLMLRNAERGDYDLLASMVISVREELGTFQAMPLSMEVASAQSHERRTRFEREARQSVFGGALGFPFPMLADDLGLLDLGAAFRSPLQIERPALLISGTLDGRTPKANTHELLPAFRDASPVWVRYASHDDELWLGNPAVATSIAAFLAGDGTRAETTLEVPEPRFAGSMVEVLEQVSGVSRWLALAGVGTALAVLGGLALGIRGLRRRISRRAVVAPPS